MAEHSSSKCKAMSSKPHNTYTHTHTPPRFGATRINFAVWILATGWQCQPSNLVAFLHWAVTFNRVKVILDQLRNAFMVCLLCVRPQAPSPVRMYTQGHKLCFIFYCQNLLGFVDWFYMCLPFVVWFYFGKGSLLAKYKLYPIVC
jgi:hypothetical protein